MLSTSVKKYGEKLSYEGKLQGIQEGIQVGIQRKAIETARALLKENMPVRKISEITGLSMEEVKKMAE